MDDADLDVAIGACVNGAFFSTGQRCTASSRLIVTKGIYDKFVGALTEAADNLVVGDALDSATQIGPVVDEKQLQQNVDYVKLAADEGCDVRGGAIQNGPGFFQKPAVFASATNDMRVSREEIFGPCASVIKADDYDEALHLANDTDFGLSAGICTTSLKYATDFPQKVKGRHGDGEFANCRRGLSRAVWRPQRVQLRPARARRICP